MTTRAGNSGSRIVQLTKFGGGMAVTLMLGTAMAAAQVIPGDRAHQRRDHPH